MFGIIWSGSVLTGLRVQKSKSFPIQNQMNSTIVNLPTRPSPHAMTHHLLFAPGRQSLIALWTYMFSLFPHNPVTAIAPAPWTYLPPDQEDHEVITTLATPLPIDPTSQCTLP